MSSENNIDHMLEKARPELTESERLVLWQKIAGNVVVNSPIKSPYYSFISTKIMTSLVAVLIFILSAGGTVAASETAKPGDLLFPIERAAERARIILASDAKAAELRNKFAQERMLELQAIIDEEIIATVASAAEPIASSSIITFSAEADVFTDITVVKIEVNDRKNIFTTSTNTKSGVIDEINVRYAISTTTIESSLDFEIKNRVSRPSERGLVAVDTNGEERISIAVNELLNLLDEFEDSEDRSGFLALLITEINNVDVSGRDGEIELKTEDTRLKINDDRVEVKKDGYRIKIKDDGEVKVEYEDDSREEDDEYEDEDREESDDDEGEYSKSVSTIATSSVLRLKAEADVFAGTTIVEIELNGRKSVFTTAANTKEAVITEIVRRYSLDRALVSSVLDFSVEVTKDTGSSQEEDDEEDEREDSDEDSDSESEDEDNEDRHEDEDREDEEEDEPETEEENN